MITVKGMNIQFDLNKKQKRILLSILILLTTILAILSTRKYMYDPDSYWHIRTGKWIFENGMAPKFDTFSWYGIQNHLSWINHEWLTDLLMYLLNRFNGLNGVMWSVCILAGILNLLLIWFTYIKSKSMGLSILLPLLSIICIQPYLQPRPQVISYCIVVLLCILMEKKKWFSAIPLVILESNLHGGFWPLLIVIIIYYSFKEKSILILWSILAVFINPYGIEMFFYSFKNQTYSVGTAYIAENQRTIMADKSNMIVLLLYIALVMVTHGIKIRRRTALFCLSVVGLTFMGERHVVFAYLLVLPVLSPFIHLRIDNQINKLSRRLKVSVNSSAVYYTMTLTPILILISYSLNIIQVIKTTDMIPFNIYPSKEIISYIKDKNIDRIMNEYMVGGYLLFNDIPTLIDGRADPFSDKFNNTDIFKDYCETVTLKKDTEDFLDKYQIKYILYTKNSPFGRSLKSNSKYKVLIEDGNIALFLYSG